MIFKLCYKSYEFKPTLAAMKQFKESTGLDLWATLIKFIATFSKGQKDNSPLGDRLHSLAQVLDFVDAAQLFYCLAKQSNSAVTIDEIEDAMFHVGILASDRDSDMSEPYPFVLYMLALDIYNYHEQLAKDTKKQ